LKTAHCSHGKRAAFNSGLAFSYKVAPEIS
jgi:hypothetical protein